MCGRAALSARSTALAAQLLDPQSSATSGTSVDVDHWNTSSKSITSITSNCNTSPGSTTHVFLSSNHSINCLQMTWGMQTPSYNKRIFNARSETIYTKPTFCDLISKKQTCVWAIDGYYEWKEKQPYFICRKDGAPLLLAGLYRNCTSSSGEMTFAILTMDACPSMERLHPRQPVILCAKQALQWLNDPCPQWVQSICSFSNNKQSTIETELHFYPVTKRMSDGKYRGEDCTKEILLGKRSLKAFFKSTVTDDETKQTRRSNIPVKSENLINTHQVGNEDFPKLQQTSQVHEPHHAKKSLETPTIRTGDNVPWTCQACTFQHTGKLTKFLTCEMCGLKRHYSKGTISKLDDEICTDDATCKAWGSLCSPGKSKKQKR